MNTPPSLVGVVLLDLERTWEVLGSADERGSVSLEDIEETDLMVVVGPPGIGKSTELVGWHNRLPDSGWVDLALIDQASALEEQCAGQTVVFIDGCDEYVGPAGPLFRALGRIRALGTAIRVSARSSWWNENSHYHGTLGPSTVLELQPLSDLGQHRLLGRGSLPGQTGPAFRSGDESLTRNPRMLIALQRAYEATGEVLETRSAIYRALALAGVEEHNPAVERAAGDDKMATLSLAQWSAACSLLCGRNTVTDMLLADDDERLSLAVLRSSEVLAPIRGSLDPRSVLHGHFMTPCEGGYRFTDRSLTEYLAASSLVGLVDERADATDLWRTLLAIEIGGESFVPPQLRGLAAWAAELNEQAFDVVFDADRSVLLENDLASHNDDGRRRLFTAVLEDDQLTDTAQYSPGTLKSAYEAADGFAELDRRLDPSSSWQTRRRAMEYVRTAGIIGFEERIMDLLLDPREDPLLRYWASKSVSLEFGESRLGRIRVALLGSEPLDDPDNRIRGNLLREMWPGFLTADQLFDALVPPTSRGVLEYESFLISHLNQFLIPEHADVALRWLDQTRPGEEWRYRIEELLSRIAAITAEHLEQLSQHQEGDREHTLRLVGAAGDDYRRLLMQLCPQLSGPDLKVIAAAIVEFTDEAGPRLASAVATCAGSEESAERGEFVAWLFAKAQFDDSHMELIWMHAFQMALDPAIDRHIVEDVLALTGPVRDRFAAIIDPVEIASVPEWQRGQLPGAAATESSAVDYLTELLSRQISWPQFLYHASISNPAHESLDETEIFDQLTEDEWDILANSAEQHVAGWTHRDDGEDFPALQLGDLAFCDALSILYRRGRLRADDMRLLSGQLTLIRAQPGLGRFHEFQAVLALSQKLDPAQFGYQARRFIEDSLMRSGTSRFDWFRDYPDGVPIGLVEHVIALLITSEKSDEDRASVLDSCVGLHDAVLRDESARLLSTFEGGAAFGAAARALLKAGLPLVDLDLPNLDSRLTKQVISAVADERRSPDSRQTIDFRSLAIGDLVALFERSTYLFARFAGIDSDHDAFEVDELRRFCLTELAMRQKPGVEALQALSIDEPLAAFMGADIARILVEDWWVPLRLDHLIQLVVDARSEIVRSAGEMLRVVQRAVFAYSEALQSFGGGADLLWANDKPRTETLLSIDLMRYLRMYFTSSSIVLNREVELRPASEHPAISGERSDLLIEASHPHRSTISLVVEIKGSWNAEKYTGYKRQLVDRYLTHPDADAGLHVVFWFDRSSWAVSDSRRKKSPNDRERMRKSLEAKKPKCSKPIAHVVVEANR